VHAPIHKFGLDFHALANSEHEKTQEEKCKKKSFYYESQLIILQMTKSKNICLYD